MLGINLRLLVDFFENRNFQIINARSLLYSLQIIRLAKKILYCVLNWGLGHASRSVPLIQKLLKEGHEIQLASDGNAALLLESEFPELVLHRLPSYDIQYRYESIVLNILLQSRKFAKAIGLEQKQISTLVGENKFDQIISDNRFGCYNKSCENIFLSHQIRLVHSKLLLSKVGTWFNKFLIHKFDKLWIPDYESANNLSGKMSHDIFLKIPINYIGPLSRFSEISDTALKKYKVICILSGPEPQRSIFEKLLIPQLEKMNGEHIIVSGIHKTEIQNKNIRILGLCASEELTKLIAVSKYIVSRSGYSSIMDYESMNRSAILVPTPGQTEQIYLAKRLTQLGRHIYSEQNNFNLEEMITTLTYK